MGKHTEIQWCDSTVNPTMGCDGCPLWNQSVRKCYAGKLTTRRAGGPGYPKSFDSVAMFPGRMEEAAQWPSLSGRRRWDKPWLDGLPRIIFVSDMSDALSKDVTFEYLEYEIIRQVASPIGRRHQWLWLTKKPKRMAEFSKWLKDLDVSWPENLWVGTSIMNARMLVGIDHLLEVGDERTLRFLSVEPQWEALDLSPWLPRLDWVIQGGEWDNDPWPFDVGWAETLLQQCRKYGVPYFLKQLGSHVVQDGVRLQYSDGHGGDWSQWPEQIRVRQMPIYVGESSLSGIRPRKVNSQHRTDAATGRSPAIPSHGDNFMKQVWTLGYAGLSSEAFVRLLVDHNIDVLVDVRQRAASRKQGFAKSALQALVAERSMRYVHVPQLGTPEVVRRALKDGTMGQLDYKTAYRQHLGENQQQVDELLRLIHESRCCLLCLEADPAQCHRSILAEFLVGRSSELLEVIHIRGEAQPQASPREE